MFGYLAALFLIAACALCIPALVAAATRTCSAWLGRSFGAEALLASRSLGASLRRSSVLIAALATAIAMMVSRLASWWEVFVRRSFPGWLRNLPPIRAKLGIEMEARTPLASQELAGDSHSAPTYWEGAIVLTGKRYGAVIAGSGYLEMTGYAKGAAAPI